MYKYVPYAVSEHPEDILHYRNMQKFELFDTDVLKKSTCFKLKIAFYSEHFLYSLSSEAMQSFLSHLHH